MSKKSNSIMSLLPWLLSAAMMIVMAACSDAPIPAAGATDKQNGLISFSLGSADIEVNSRVTYSGLSSTFEEGELIGCVIANISSGTPVYLANSAWSYHAVESSPASFGSSIKLAKLFDKDNNAIAIDTDGNTIIRHLTADELTEAEIDPAADPLAPYYIKLLNETADYAFYFYYPYVDDEILKAEITYKAGWPVKADFENFSYPNIYENSEYKYKEFYQNTIPDQEINKLLNESSLLSPISDSGSSLENKIKTASWLKYPVTASTNFKRAKNMDILNHSDFMYTSVTEYKGEKINAAASIGEIQVIMRKQFATVDLCFENRPSEVYLQPSNDGGYTMPRIKDFNLATGEFAGEYSYNQNGTLLEKNAVYNSNIYPQYIGTEEGWSSNGEVKYHIYRFIMTPQTALKCNIVFKIPFEEQFTLKDVGKRPALSSLKSGYYYKLRFSSMGSDSGWHLYIEDWKDGGSQTLNRP